MRAKTHGNRENYLEQSGKKERRGKTHEETEKVKCGRAHREKKGREKNKKQEK